MFLLVQRVWRWCALVLGTGLGLGFIPVAPGTFGSLLGPVLVGALQQRFLDDTIPAAEFAPTHLPPVYWGIALLLIIAGGPICHRAARHFEVKDPGSVVYDEIVSFFLVFFAVKVTWTTAILGFVWFRVFDISKPWPVKRLEKLPGGWGILVDDLAAGVYACVALWVTMWGARHW